MRWQMVGVAMALASCRGAAIEVRHLDTGDDTTSDVTITTTGNTTDDVTTDVLPSTDDGTETTGPIPTGACPQVHVIQADAPAVREFDIADLDGDGVHELLAVDVTQTSPGSPVVSIYYLVPTGDAFQAVELAFELFGEYRGFADLDGDGRKDLFLWVDGGYVVLPVIAAPQFVLGDPRPLIPLPRTATFFDLDDDGLTDVLASDEQMAMLVGIGDGTGAFAFTSLIPFPVAASPEATDARTPTWCGVLFEEFTDVGCFDASIVTFAVDPAGGWIPGQASDTRGYQRILDLVDIDGSGEVDVFVELCEEPPGSTVGVELLVSSPDGLVPTLSITDLAWAETADLDGNGEVDVVFASGTDGTVGYHPFIGGGLTPVVVGGAANVAAHAHGHGRLFGDTDEQVLLSYPSASGTTWAYVSGDPC